MLAWLILDHPHTLLAQTTLLHNSEAPLEAQKIIALKGSTAPRPDHQLLPLLVFFEIGSLSHWTGGDAEEIDDFSDISDYSQNWGKGSVAV